MRITSVIQKLPHELTLLSPRHSHLQQSLTPGDYHDSYLAAEVLLVFQKLHEATFILKKRFKKERQRCQRAEVNGPANRLHRSRTQPGFKFQTKKKHQEDGCGSPGHTAFFFFFPRFQVFQDSQTRLKT